MKYRWSRGHYKAEDRAMEEAKYQNRELEGE